MYRTPAPVLNFAMTVRSASAANDGHLLHANYCTIWDVCLTHGMATVRVRHCGAWQRGRVELPCTMQRNLLEVQGSMGQIAYRSSPQGSSDPQE